MVEQQERIEIIQRRARDAALQPHARAFDDRLRLDDADHLACFDVHSMLLYDVGLNDPPKTSFGGTAEATACAYGWQAVRSDHLVIPSGELAEQLRLAHVVSLVEVQEEDPLAQRHGALAALDLLRQILLGRAGQGSREGLL